MNITRIEEWINSMSHYLGVALALFGTGVLFNHSLQTSNTGYIIGSLIFGFSLVLLYSMSGTYHILYEGKAKYIFKILDHSAIYILISSSYTPYLLGYFEGNTKWILFSILWIMTIIGIVFKIYFVGRFKYFSTFIYLFMGWLIIFVFDDLKKIITPLSLKLLISCGVTYSIGTIFYCMKKIKFTHGIWHLFVLAGSILNYLSIYYI